VRVQLVAQHLELRFLGERRLLERRFAFELQPLVKLHAVVERGPSQKQRHRIQRVLEDVERMSCEITGPFRL
jgi:hypothetical protein